MLFITVFLLSGCSYFFGEKVSLKGCFKPYSVFASQLSDPLYKNSNNYRYDIYLREQGYHYIISTIQVGTFTPVKGKIEFTGDMEFSIPDWAGAYIGGNSIALYLSVLHQNQQGVFGTHSMIFSNTPFSQYIEPHCKKAILKICDGRMCDFKEYLNIQF
jgi:hypothetical protein